MSKRSLTTSITAGVMVCLCLAIVRFFSDGSAQNVPAAPVKQLDQSETRLHDAAVTALGKREGAIVIVDAQTGRIISVVNPKLAFENAAPPGSTVKPFAALAAMRSGVLAQDTQIRCRGTYKRAERVDTCSHQPNQPPFDVTNALAHSCNYYFAKVGERLDRDNFINLLTEFGFGETTGISDETESAGVLARGRWENESAIGEGPFLQVTPVQLAMAYNALFNGGRLFKPAIAPANPQLRSELRIDDKERELLRRGLAGAVIFGTASKANYDSLPGYVLGKTGTATQLQGYHTQGWFAGIAFPVNAKPIPPSARLTVVVHLKNARGLDAAEVARSIFAEFYGVNTPNTDSTYVTVHRVKSNVTRSLPLEDYILQVVSNEAGVEKEPEALKALAITARTYALKNLGRHKDQGYDFCNLTHCQRFEPVNARPEIAAAIRETAGMVLQDVSEQLADPYFSASCGGMTANIKTLWGAEGPEYLHGVRDDYCTSGPHYRWTDSLTPEQLLIALRSDPRTDVGKTVRELSVTRHDQTGRAETISILGNVRRVISGWEFKLIVGRSLGWNILKSSRFTISRSGSEFVFRGGGFGHGLGLCQEGSHVMAERGHKYQQILSHYFPGTSVTQIAQTRKSSVSLRRRVSTTHFQLTYPRTVETGEAEGLLNFLETNRTELLRRVSAAGLEPRIPDLQVVLNETTGDFVGRTGMSPWTAAATKGNRIELQPLHTLKQRGILETTLRHELVHVLIDSLDAGPTPRWFTEGMAVYFAGEGKLLERYHSRDAMPAEMVEKALTSAGSADEMRKAYAAAYNLVRELIRAEGEQKTWKRAVERRYI